MLLEILLSSIALIAALLVLHMAGYIEKDTYVRKTTHNDLITGLGILACIDLLIMLLFFFYLNDVISSILFIAKFNGVVTVPIVEECIFRAGVIGFSKRKFGNYKIGFIISAPIFAFAHIFNQGFTPAFIPYFTTAGIIYGYGYIRYGLISCIILHGLSNLLVYTLFTLI